jgi:hypothetical protein
MDLASCLPAQDVILSKPIEEWPVVETLLSWHSDGFPLEKAQVMGERLVAALHPG